ncbi:peroxisomal docking factor component pex13 [Lichtheimia corymbifera JMRC:FSU:9682]|uniref:Peroxisomal membrane protein PEX13 n=1 Tax=Lichtheimia corymbifera JMRC:FSU:9682 TaxID=1263082 RepID=A0A068RW07_9FUNG|nr:peroxisomal docking factor component pex13 [Lichtheimia corymbifera JMRC:FSU:9682]
MPSPPKPWEVSNGTSAAMSSVATGADTSSAITSATESPTVPNRPSTLNSTGSTTFGGTGYGSGLGTYGSSYNSPYSRYGGYGSSMGSYGLGGYSGYGSYGSYGGYGGYGGYSGFGSPYSRFGTGYGRFGGYGAAGGPGDEFSLTQRMESSTRATFEVIEQIVGAFGGFAQMLDSTFMATHSSFMAMVGVAEQFGHLRHYLGNLLGIFALIRWLRRLYYRLTGRTPPAEQEEQSQQEGEQHQQEEEVQSQQEQQPKKQRSILFMLTVFVGLPYMMYKLFRKAAEYHKQRMLLAQRENEAIVLYDFVPEDPMEISLRRGDTVEVLSKVDPATGEPSSWWHGRLSNGTTGLFPANYVQLQHKKLL